MAINRAEQEWPDGETVSVASEMALSKRELRSLFYVGRKLQLIDCLLPMSAPQERTVLAQRSYGYDMAKADGRVSRLDFESGQRIVGVSDAGNGFTAVKILTHDGEIAAHYVL